MDDSLKTGKLIPLLIRYSIPAIVCYFISELYNMVDSYFVGNAVGSSAIAALGIVFPIQRLLIAFSLLFSFAASNLLANFIGAKNKKMANYVISSTVGLNFLIIVPYTLLVYIFRDKILTILSAHDEIYLYSREYLSIIIWGSIFLTLGTCFARLLLVFGKSTASIICSASGAIINIIFDYIFVYLGNQGVLGAAYATLISQIISCFISAVFLLKLMHREKVAISTLPSAGMMFKLFKTGLPSFVVESEDAIVLAVLNLVFFKAAGSRGIAILSLNIKAYMLLFVIVLGLAYGMQTIIAYNYGAKNFSRVRSCLRISLIFNILTSSVITMIFYLFSYQILNIFIKEEILLNEASIFFRRMIIVFPILAIYYSAITYLQASMKEISSMILTFFRQLIFLCPMMLIAIYLFNTEFSALFYIYPITDIMAAIIGSVVLYISIYKLKDSKYMKKKHSRVS